MGATQRKPSPGMVKTRKVIPRRGGMARLAFHRLSVQPRLLHQFREASLVRIGVTTGASEIWPVVARHRLGFGIARRLVAIAARNRNVTSAQPEWRFIVAAQ